MKKQDPKKKKKVDPYLGVKFLGYRLSVLPDPYSMKDLIRHAKFFLAQKSGRLLKDPIWDEYTVEELLMEFYAHQMHDNERLRTDFEASLNFTDGAIDEFAAWADKQIAEEGKIRDSVMGGAEDHISFSPDDVMGEDE